MISAIYFEAEDVDEVLEDKEQTQRDEAMRSVGLAARFVSLCRKRKDWA